MIKILIVEPDEKICKKVKNWLLDSGFDVRCRSGEERDLILLIDEVQPDLLIADEQVAEKTKLNNRRNIVRKKYFKLPIIILVSDLESEDFIKKYRNGVDDFLVKPLDKKRLIARVEMHLTDQKTGKKEYQVADLKLNLENYEVKRGNKKIDLTPQEFKLLKYLMRNSGRVLSREMILSRVWGYDVDVQSRAVDVYIGYLRKAIDGGQKKKLIQTKRGFGYFINS